MANQQQFNILEQGAEAWNTWREEHPTIQPDLSGADLSLADLSRANLCNANFKNAYLCETVLDYASLSMVDFSMAVLSRANFNRADLSLANLTMTDASEAHLGNANIIGADLSNANLHEAILHGAKLIGANLNEADLSGADLSWADLSSVNLIGANLHEADLRGATLSGADLSGADLSEANLNGANLNEANLNGANLNKADLSATTLIEANLSEAILMEADLSEADLSKANLNGAYLIKAYCIETNLNEANLTDCSIYGISAWKVQLDRAIQSNLIITPDYEPTITVDDLKIAQFIYLLLNNQNIRDVIDTIGQKGVLILGRFSQERKLVLDALREKLRALNFLPIVFDFERPTERDFTETIMTLAGLSCFIIADITNPKSSPLELQATVPNYMIPFVPIIQQGEQPFSMFQDLKGKYGWVLDTLVYDNLSNLIKGLDKAVVKPALEMRDVLLSKKVEQLRMRHIGDYL